MPTSETLHRLLDDVLAPAHFFIAPTLRVVWDRCAETNVSWELFQGRLLDPAHTRQRRSFASWNLYALTGKERSVEPLLSLKLDADAGEVHVVRGLDCYTWEGYDAGGGVFLSREVRKWVRELAGTVRLDRFALLDELRHELVCQVFHAIVGASRLPLASVETPLSQFSLGQLFYCYRPYAGVRDRQLESYRDLSFWMLTKHTAWPVRGRLLETFLHAVPFAEMDAATDHFVRCWATHSQGEKGVERNLATLLRTLFNNVSLSPYTDLVDKTLAFVHALEMLGTISPATAADFLGHLLRQNGRHLTAYDLVTFHHRGANYPDALLLDAVLKDYLARIERQPDLFNGTTDDARRRRRALRQGYVLRRRYENHPVPDQPTSPGENMRVLPIPRVPDEQLTQPHRRTKRLFADDPLSNYITPNAEAVLRQSVADLDHPDEQREMGMALFLDRPFGVAKRPAEPDATLLLSAEAFSRSVVDERLRLLQTHGLLTPEQCVFQRRRLAELEIKGLPLDAVGSPSRPGTIALSEARRAAPDFVFLRTTAATLRELFAQYDFARLQDRFSLDVLSQPRDLLLARAANGTGLILYDADFRPRLELEVDTQSGYERRRGREVPVAGLRVLRIGEERIGEAVTIEARL